LDKKKEKEKKPIEDLGFGSKFSDQNSRFINKDGSFNVERKGISYLKSRTIYGWLISISWVNFFLIIFTVYTLFNAIFAFGYLMIGMENLAGVQATTPVENYLEAFFFSIQSFTTVGYGRISPLGLGANILAAFESLVGLLSLAIATGLLFAKFTRPISKIIYSKKAAIAPYSDGKGFMFRIANQLNNQLVELEVIVSLSLNQFENGKSIRKFYQLPLERNQIQFFPLTWTIVHPIDENSPLYNYTHEDFIQSDAEFLILLKGFDDAFSQTVHSRYSYKYYEVIWGGKFNSVFKNNGNGKVHLHLDQIHDIEKIQF